MSSEIIQGFIYAIQGRTLRHIKIGFSTRPGARLMDLQLCSPDKLDLIGLWPGSMEDESLLHRQFMDLCVHGEWFRECARTLGIVRTRSVAELVEQSNRQSQRATTPETRLQKNQQRFSRPTCGECRTILQNAPKTKYAYPRITHLYEIGQFSHSTEGGHQWCWYPTIGKEHKELCQLKIKP